MIECCVQGFTGWLAVCLFRRVEGVLLDSVIWEKTLLIAMGDWVTIALQSLDSKDDQCPEGERPRVLPTQAHLEWCATVLDTF